MKLNASGKKMIRFTGTFFPNPLVNTARALWDNLWDMTSVNEEAFPRDTTVRQVLPYGDWETRYRKAERLLYHFYLIYFGQKGEEIVKRYMNAMRTWQWAGTVLAGIRDDDPRLAEANANFAKATEELDGLLGGVRVTDRAIEVPEGHESLRRA